MIIIKSDDDVNGVSRLIITITFQIFNLAYSSVSKYCLYCFTFTTARQIVSAQIRKSWGHAKFIKCKITLPRNMFVGQRLKNNFIINVLSFFKDEFLKYS